MHNALKGSKDSENNVLVQGEESGKEKANRPTYQSALCHCTQKKHLQVCQMMRAWHSTSCAFIIESPYHLCKQKVSC
jgi:hypothetical protein